MLLKHKLSYASFFIFSVPSCFAFTKSNLFLVKKCAPCKKGEENYCQGPISCTLTYNGAKASDAFNTYGGYSTDIVVREDFVLKIPDELESQYAGPIMCAGVTVYSPMKHWGVKEGTKLGVAGIGGLGHMAVKLGKVLGAEVTAFTRSESKKEQILQMGADKVVISADSSQMADAANSLDLLINTVPVAHDISDYIPLMKTDSTIVVVGNVVQFPEFSPGPLVFNRIGIAGSLIGGIQETQEVLDLCAKHDIKPVIRKIHIEDINDVFDSLAAGEDTDFRHVIDIESLRKLDAVQNDQASSIAPPARGL